VSALRWERRMAGIYTADATGGHYAVKRIRSPIDGICWTASFHSCGSARELTRWASTMRQAREMCEQDRREQ
jgi:hypothetical protein